MTEHEKNISIDLLKSLVRLDEATGRLFWKERDISVFVDKKRMAEHSLATWNTRFAGKEAFCHSSGNGYLHGCLFNRKYYAHRIVFALFHGHWPKATIDHINGIKTDNRPVNLRDVSHQENMFNQPLKKSNSSGHSGVSLDSRGKYAVAIMVDGKTKHFGSFDNINDAIAVHKEKATALGFHSNHGRKVA